MRDRGGKKNVKAITLIQPWATLVADGAKMIETRSWGTKYRGFMAVHAGTMLQVTRRFNGYDLTGVVCSKCCMSVHITRVRESHLRPLAAGELKN